MAVLGRLGGDWVRVICCLMPERGRPGTVAAVGRWSGRQRGTGRGKLKGTGAAGAEPQPGVEGGGGDDCMHTPGIISRPGPQGCRGGGVSQQEVKVWGSRSPGRVGW